MRKKRIFTAFIAFTLLIFLSGCKVNRAKIAVTTYPIQYLFDRIGGNNVKVENISDDGTIQTATIKKNYKNTLEDSKALFYITELEPYFDVYSADLRTNKVSVINLANKSVFYKFQRYTTTFTDGKSAVVESPYYQGDIFKDIDVYKNDPMIWMDPISMISAAEIIRDYLMENYPEFKSAFLKNFDALELDLTRLDMDFQELKSAEGSLSFVSMTPSFGPWQKSYGISYYPVCLSKFGALPSEEQLAVIEQKIIDDGVKYIAYESNLNAQMNQLYQRVKEDLGLIEVDLSNVSSLSTKQKKENKDYLTIMYENLSVLEKMGNGEY